jgi:hypothetical protein
MKSSCLLAVLLLLSGIGRCFADAIELNGITCLFGDKMAVLVLHGPAQIKPVSFALSEGQSRFGIKLLAVDATNHSVKIEQSGVEQSLRLCGIPVLAMPDTRVTAVDGSRLPRPLTSQEQSEVDRFVKEDQDAQKIKAGNPVVNVVNVGTPPPSIISSGASANSSGSSSGGTSAGSSAAGSGSVNGGAAGQGGTPGAGSSADGLAGSASTGSGSASSSSVDYTQEPWYRASLVMEQNRLATAAMVSSGDMEPLARTPLTPPQTPPGLIGPDTFFSNRIPGFVDQSSVDD